MIKAQSYFGMQAQAGGSKYINELLNEVKGKAVWGKRIRESLRSFRCFMFGHRMRLQHWINRDWTHRTSVTGVSEYHVGCNRCPLFKTFGKNEYTGATKFLTSNGV